MSAPEDLDTLPGFLIERLNHPPRAGGGLHQWIFACACHLHIHLDENAIVELLLEKAASCGRPPDKLEREVRTTVRNAISYMWLPDWPARYALRVSGLRRSHDWHRARHDDYQWIPFDIDRGRGLFNNSNCSSECDCRISPPRPVTGASKRVLQSNSRVSNGDRLNS
jgi:hypothetical protein